MDPRGGWERSTLPLVGVPAAVAVGAIALTRVVNAPNLLWDIAWTAGALSAVIGVLLGRRRAVGRHRFRWTMWSAAAGLWLGGQVAWNCYGAHIPPSPNLGDVGWWGFAICAMVGVMRMPARSRSLRTVAMVETLPLIAAAMALTTAELWHDTAISTLAMSSRVAVLGYPALYVAAAVVTFQALLGGWMRGESSIPSRLILLGIAVQAVTFSFWTERLLDQTYVVGHNWLDPMFVLGMLLMGAGGAWASRAPQRMAAINEPPRRGGVLPATIFVVLWVALLQMQLAGAPEQPRFAI